MDDPKSKLEDLSQRAETYLSLIEADSQVHTRESINIFTDWYFESRDIFEKYFDESERNFSEFISCDVSGNGYVLASKFSRIYPLFKILKEKILTGYVSSKSMKKHFNMNRFPFIGGPTTAEDLDGSYTRIKVNIRAPMERGVDYLILNLAEGGDPKNPEHGMYAIIPTEDTKMIGPGVPLHIQEQIIKAPKGSPIILDPEFENAERMDLNSKMNKLWNKHQNKSKSSSVFKIPDEPVDPDLVAVMMPFTAELRAVYETIKEASSEVGLNCKRVDDIWEHSTIIQDVFSLIYRSHIVVCDVTGKNPNVFYEAGIAHTLGKHVIPIAQSDDDVPFDLKHHRYVKYLNNGEGLQKLKQVLVSRYKTLSK